jgi:hypothetical protein
MYQVLNHPFDLRNYHLICHGIYGTLFKKLTTRILLCSTMQELSRRPLSNGKKKDPAFSRILEWKKPFSSGFGDDFCGVLVNALIIGQS